MGFFFISLKPRQGLAVGRGGAVVANCWILSMKKTISPKTPSYSPELLGVEKHRNL